MHELSLAMNLVEIIEAEAQTQRFTQVRGILLELGSLSCVEPEAMRLAFEVACRGTLVEGAELQMEIQAGVARCFSCSEESPVSSFLEPCPRCGAMGMEAISGQQLRIKELEVE